MTLTKKQKVASDTLLNDKIMLFGNLQLNVPMCILLFCNFIMAKPNILHGVFDQGILLRRGRKCPLYLTPILKITGTPNLACRLVFPKFFKKIDNVIIVMSQQYFPYMTSFL